MATYGFSDPWMAKLDEEAGTYSDGFKCGEAVSGTFTPQYQSTTLSGDDKVVESVDVMTSLDVSLNVTTIPKVANTVIFGHQENSEGEFEYKTTDVANPVGMGFFESEMIHGVSKYIATFLPKVKYKEGAKNCQTKGENLSFATPTLTGTGMADANDKYQITKVFDTKEEAVAWIKGKLNIQ